MPTIRYKNDNEWIDVLHPVGSFYFSVEEDSPANLFGGVWSRITGGAIRGMEEDKTSGYVGADTHQLVINEMPVHGHAANLNYAINNTIPTNIGFAFNSTGGLYRERVITDNLGSYGNIGILNNTGGGQHTQSCNAPSTVSSGTERLSKVGDRECLTLNTKPQTAHGKTFSTLLERIISQMKTSLQRLSMVVHGHKSQMVDLCDLPKIQPLAERIAIRTPQSLDMISMGTMFIFQTIKALLQLLRQALQLLRPVIKIQVAQQDNLIPIAHRLSHLIEDATFGIGQHKILTSIGGEIYA